MISIEMLTEYVHDIISNSASGLFFPRNSEYMSATELVKWLAAEYRIKVCYTKLFNPFIRCLKIGLVSKVFGDYVYKD